MNQNQCYRLQVKATDQQFQVQGMETAEYLANAPSAPTETPVEESVIGYWIELVGQDCEVIYRKFLNNLPLNLPHSWEQWGKRKRQKARYAIDVPALPNAIYAKLYEQRFNAPGQKTPERTKHFQVELRGAA